MTDIVPVLDGQIVLDLDQIADQIRVEHEACEAAGWSTVQHAIRAGQLLHDAKAQVPHGAWLPWLEANFEGTANLAQRYMKLGANAARVQHLSSLREALAELTAKSTETKKTPLDDRALRCVQHENAEDELRRMVVSGGWRQEGFPVQVAWATAHICFAHLHDAGAHVDLGYEDFDTYARERLGDLMNALIGLDYEMALAEARP